MFDVLEQLLNTRSLVTNLGAVGVFCVLFAETGLLIGFFLPGDSLLFSIGVLAATGALPGPYSKLITVAAAVAGALLGSHVGYVIGDRGGAAVLRRVRNPRVHHAVERSGAMLERYGHGKALVLGRFIPVVRTVVSPVAGITGVPLRTFTFWQVLGGLVWTVGMSAAGYLLGLQFPEIDKYLLPMIGIVVAATVIPVLWEMFRPQKTRPAAEGSADATGTTAPAEGSAGGADGNGSTTPTGSGGSTASTGSGGTTAPAGNNGSTAPADRTDSATPATGTGSSLPDQNGTPRAHGSPEHNGDSTHRGTEGSALPSPENAQSD